MAILSQYYYYLHGSWNSLLPEFPNTIQFSGHLKMVIRSSSNSFEDVVSLFMLVYFKGENDHNPMNIEVLVEFGKDNSIF